MARFRVRRRVAHPAAAFTITSGGAAGFLSAMVTGAVAGSLLACARARIYAGCAKNGGSELAVLGEALTPISRRVVTDRPETSSRSSHFNRRSSPLASPPISAEHLAASTPSNGERSHAR